MNRVCEEAAVTLLTEPEAAKTLRVSPRTLWGLRKAGRIRWVRYGTRGVRYDLVDIRAFIDAHKVTETAPLCLN
jgi:hypothetical protein